MTRLIGLVWLGHLLCAQQLLPAQDVTELLHRYFEANKANALRASQYTFRQEVTRLSYDKAGVARQTLQESHEVIFVEGEVYKRLISRNGQPLNAKDQAKEEKKLQDVAGERRKQRRPGLFRRSFSISDSEEDSKTLFENRLLGEEEINGRKAWVIELEPRTDRKPANDHERDALSFRRKIWVDQAEHVGLRWEATAIGDKIALKPGTKYRIEYAKINDDAWLATSVIVDIRAQLFKFAKENTRQETKNSGFQKFDVQSTITIDRAE